MNTNIPVKIMRVEDFRKFAIHMMDSGQWHDEQPDIYVVQIQERYEKETSQILERKHFVVEAEKPKELTVSTHAETRAEQLRAEEFLSAQSQLVFEGFKDGGDADRVMEFNSPFRIKFWQHRQVSLRGLIEAEICQCTIYDFIYHISKYNETATQKINLKFTENFIKRIVG